MLLRCKSESTINQSHNGESLYSTCDVTESVKQSSTVKYSQYSHYIQWKTFHYHYHKRSVNYNLSVTN
jgi:trehalose-6-phosphate synthase